MALLTSLLRAPRRDEAQLAHALRSLPLFQEVRASDLVAIWRNLHEVRLAAGTPLCQRGEPGDCMYVLQAGELEVRIGLGESGVTMRRILPGDFVGEMALLTDAPRSADVVATEECVLWSLDRADFEAIMAGSPSLTRALTRQLARRLQETTRLLEQ